MILSIIGLVALVGFSSACFALVVDTATLLSWEQRNLAVPDSSHERTSMRLLQSAIACGLSFFGALALLGSLLS